MAEARIAHSAWLSPEELQAIRVLLDEAFGGEVTDDYEHALGGMHARVWQGRDLIGHGSVVMRRMLHGRRALRTGYVEGVAVRADRRRRGHAAALMGAPSAPRRKRAASMCYR
jgi:aminoglycoside 2'-N-acetyltransferase I